jgi:hypothetical protein
MGVKPGLRNCLLSAAQQWVAEETKDGTACQPTIGLVVSEIKQNLFLCINGQFFDGLTA